MQRLERNQDFLKVLSCCNKKQCKVLLEGAHTDLIKCLCECVANVIKGNVPIRPQHKRKLLKHKSLLRTLANKKKPLRQKKQKLVQHGGAILPFLLPAIFSAVTSLFGLGRKK